MNATVPISASQLLVAASLVGVNALLSIALSLGLGRAILVASVRTFIQLSLVGYVLVPVFATSSGWGVALVALAMVLLAARESVHRTGHRYPGVAANAFLAILVSSVGVTVAALGTIIRVEPWYAPRYLIPILGMILGNALTGISLGLDRYLDGLRMEKLQVEGLLAAGATPWRAGRAIVRKALRAGTTPILNTMSVVGLVSLPGMMTGQILAGNDPWIASRYQIVIMFLIASATAIGATLAILLAHRALFDSESRLALEKLRRP